MALLLWARLLLLAAFAGLIAAYVWADTRARS
jgi:hypothetical protein